MTLDEIDNTVVDNTKGFITDALAHRSPKKLLLLQALSVNASITSDSFRLQFLNLPSFCRIEPTREQESIDSFLTYGKSKDICKVNELFTISKTF